MKKLHIFILWLVLLGGSIIIYNNIDLSESSFDDSPTANLLKEAEEAYTNNDFNKIVSVLNTLTNSYPESKELAEVLQLRDSYLEKEKEREIYELSFKKLKKDFDDIAGITWYKNSLFTHVVNNSRVSVYIGQKENDTWLRLKISCKRKSLLSFNKAYLFYPNKTFEITFKSSDKQTDIVGLGEYAEWIDVKVDDEILAFLTELSESNEAKVRLSSRKYDDTRTLSKDEINGIKEVLNGYRFLMIK